MSLLTIVQAIDNSLALPSTVIFLAAGILLSIKTRFIQLHAFRRFIRLIKRGSVHADDAMQERGTINPFHALFAAMSTTLGMGNIVSPSVAIICGGPGALFWLAFYAFFASVTKYTEVTYALDTRVRTPDGHIIGGPMEYLRQVSKFLANWYGIILIFLMASWSGKQANTLAEIFSLEGVPQWQTGAILAVITFVVLNGGAKRFGLVASKAVPIMTTLYLLFALIILFQDFSAVGNAFSLIFNNIFSPAAAFGGFMGASIFQAMREGVYGSIFITEAGLGTSSIAHALADVKRPTDQGVLAMYSMVVDVFLSTLSGLLVLVSGVWTNASQKITGILMYRVFKEYSPLFFGKYVLLMSVALFVTTTVVGNSFNGRQSFAYFTRNRFVDVYYFLIILVIFSGAVAPVPLIWKLSDVLLAMVAVPHLIGLIALVFKRPQVLKS